jgi:hypothetical protein
MKFNNRSKKSMENLENTLGERENHLGFEDSEGKGSQIFKKSKGFGGDLKILRERGVKSLRNRRDSVEKTQNCLQSHWPPQ